MSAQDLDRKRYLQIAAVATGLLVATGVVGAIVQAVNDDERPTAATSTSARVSAAPSLEWGGRSQTERPVPACLDAPAVVIDIVNASFTDGERLRNAQAVEIPSGRTYVGGDVTRADGSRLANRQVWLVDGPVVYAISEQARRHTLLPNGRDVESSYPLSVDLSAYKGELWNCVARADALGPG